MEAMQGPPALSLSLLPQIAFDEQNLFFPFISWNTFLVSSVSFLSSLFLLSIGSLL